MTIKTSIEETCPLLVIANLSSEISTNKIERVLRIRTSTVNSETGVSFSPGLITRMKNGIKSKVQNPGQGI